MERKEENNRYTEEDKNKVDRLVRELSQSLKAREELDSIPTQDEADASKIPPEVEELDLFTGEPIVDDKFVASISMSNTFIWWDQFIMCNNT